MAGVAREVKDKIEKEFEVKYSIRSIERIMKKLIKVMAQKD